MRRSKQLGQRIVKVVKRRPARGRARKENEEGKARQGRARLGRGPGGLGRATCCHNRGSFGRGRRRRAPVERVNNNSRVIETAPFLNQSGTFQGFDLQHIDTQARRLIDC